MIGAAVVAAAAVVVAAVLLVPRPGGELAGTPHAAAPAGRAAGAAIKVGAGPIQLTSGAGHLWTANPLAASISRIDPATGTSRDIAVGGQPRQVVVGAGKAWVWNYTSAITPVDAATGGIGELIRIELPIGRIAAGAGAVWFTVPDRNVVGRIDMATGTWSGETIPVGQRPGPISVDGDEVHVLNQGDATLTTIDATSRRPVGPARKLPAGVEQVDAAYGRVYVAGPAGMGVLGPGELTASQLVPLDGAAVFSAAARSVWVVDAGRNEVRRLSPDLRTALGGPITGIGAGVGDLREVDGTVWIADRTAGTVAGVEPAPL